MQPLHFDSLSFQSGGQRIFLVSGELHYFRVPHTGWRDRLEKLKAAGGNCVATYVPWLLHEPAEEQFDFNGGPESHSPQLDFERFLDLCAEVGLWAVVRPGPYQYSELLHGGLPDWLLKGYPEILARRLDGALINRELSISYLHPTFLEKTRRWYEAVVPRLAARQVGRGGAVAAVQIDNELMGIHEWFGGWDYHPESMGVGREAGRWAGFLQARYGSLAALNAAWETQFGAWAEALPVETAPQAKLSEVRRLKDYNDFYFSVAAEFIALLGGWLCELGIEVPLIHNSGGPGMNAYFEETLRRMGPGFLLGSDHYYNLGLDWGDGTHPTPKYASKVFYSLEMLRHFGKPPAVLEMPGGSAMDFPPITAHDIECAYLTNLAYGMKGYNIYVFAGGANPPGAADPSVGMSVYDYGAGISPTGELRELYHVQKKVAGFIHTHPWLTTARRLADCRLGLVREYARSSHYAQVSHPGGLPVSNYAAWTLMRKGLMMTAFCASLSPEMADLSADGWVDEVSTPLMVAVGTSLEAAIQKRLVNFVENGGKLLLVPCLPSLDENFRPCTRLAEYLNTPRVGGELQRPLEAAPVLYDACTGGPIGWEVRKTSGGAVILLERAWVIGRRWDEDMLRQALARLGCQPVVQCNNPNVWTSVITDGTQSMLFMLNLFTAPLTARVLVRLPAARGLGQPEAWIDAGSHILPGITVKTVDLGIDHAAA
jgi:beta-galactosidase